MSGQNSEIVEFFKNQTIFITGGTGFLGKLVIEKLLRACWDLKRIYVLVRPKRGKTPEERFEEFFDYPCFDLIKTKNLKDKVFPMSGDCEKPSLGLTSEQVEILEKETTCFIHLAANVKFDQTPKEASQIVRTTGDVLDLAKRMPGLKVFVHVSTAYSSCVHRHVKEELYEPPLKPATFLDLAESLDERVLRNATPALLDAWPNVYVYAKGVSEGLIKRSDVGVPTAVVRPSIVINSLEEPVEGWIDNMYGYLRCIVGGYLGVLRSFHAGKDVRVNSVPADHVANCILAACWGTARAKPEKVVYNVVGQKIRIQRIVDLVTSYHWELASVKAVWYRSYVISDRFWDAIYDAFYTIFAYVIDAILFCLGRKTMAVRKYKTVNRGLQILTYFSTHEWTFDESNVVSLRNAMSDVDRKLFRFCEEFDWDPYIRNLLLGLRIYFLKDPIETLPKAQKKLRVLFVLHYGVLALLYYAIYLFGKVIYKLFF